eukprot:5039272-Alexandrium_andersonii.AAC.1
MSAAAAAALIGDPQLPHATPCVPQLAADPILMIRRATGSEGFGHGVHDASDASGSLAPFALAAA